MGCFVVGNCLCVRLLLNVLAAKGEQGELGSDWCSGSCAPLCCALPCWLGRFCDVPSLFWVVVVDGVGMPVFWRGFDAFFEGGGWCLEEGLF